MNIAIVKYNAGNTQSVIYALERLGIDANVTDDPQELWSADKVIFPGVGEASSAMRYLWDKNLDKILTDLRQPFLGICLGMQLMCSHSEENDVPCLNIFSEKVKRFPKQDDPTIKIPHMGWNTLTNLKSNLFKEIPEDCYAYFVHSYYVEKTAHTIAETDYISPFSAAIQKDNFYAVQFHPEKSEKTGATILENFIKYC
jgi:imidazole glycerol-phosphate synthase subunit HisH